MGLDMYLETEFAAPKGSPLFMAIEKHLTPVEVLDDDGFWIPGSECNPSPAYAPIIAEMQFTPHDGSPWLTILRGSDEGYKIRTSVYYWRKANAIHRWFVENVQNGVDRCERHSVHPEALMDLIERCERIALDNSLADSLLPTQGGFFFGPTDYDEYYFKDIEDTVVKLKAQIGLLPAGSKFYYLSSW